MTDRLKLAIDLAEKKPKLKKILLEVAMLEECWQDKALDLMELVLAERKKAREVRP